MIIGLLHPGEMGAGMAATLVSGGHRVMWLPEGRSEATASRAETLGLTSVASLDEMVNNCPLIISICPPHAAVEVALQVAATPSGFQGLYLDANAIAPSTATKVAEVVTGQGARYVDACVIGPPPPAKDTRLYLAGSHAGELEKVFSGAGLETRALGPSPTAASALKMTYAAWTKGTAALILAIRAAARHHGVDQDLTAEWERSAPELFALSERAARSAMTKGWRWVGEMEEVASTLAEADLPDGFARAAAEVYRRVPRRTPQGEADLRRVVDDLLPGPDPA